MSVIQNNIESEMEEDDEEEEEDDDEDDEELFALREMKNQLLTEVCELKEKLIAEERRRELEANANFIGIQLKNGEVPKTNNKRKEIEFTERILGFHFDDVSKTFLQDDVYQYKATVTKGDLRMIVELTTRMKNKESSEILKIDTHFPDTELDECYRKEIEPWINMLTEMKDFSSLILAFTNYVDQSYVRGKILKRLEKRKYVTQKSNSNEEGGLIVNVYSPKNVDDIQFTLQWATRFLKKTWQIEHFFIMESNDDESSFVNKHSKILKQFSRSTLTKTDIEEIWNDIINAIENEEQISE
ncbi:uncharacterized protein LOC127278283 [Leptopilina boulardi]|uniref:uncharacterized protein LOC127278283 n=1 Tax=Leptopilina boulardi TaxID=63433 RepID=UPI0021F60965|nr:uncharacterized protein LOC127278283 [Leptopilina boulardi]